MTDAKVIAVVPARMASTRFPGKPLAEIGGLPMIEHVRRRALLAEGIADVVVATCDKVIFDTVVGYGGKAAMTAPTHERSSERVAEAMRSLAADVVINAQGDEPLLLPLDLERVCRPFKKDAVVCCVSLLSPLESEVDGSNPNIVKAACDRFGRVVFFSRAPIPYRMKPGTVPVYRETGIRAFRSDFLQTYVKLSETPLEKVESVDMLRVVEHGYPIHSAMADAATVGVDHPSDIAIVEKLLNTDPVQRDLHKRITREWA